MAGCDASTGEDRRFLYRTEPFLESPCQVVPVMALTPVNEKFQAYLVMHWYSSCRR